MTIRTRPEGFKALAAPPQHVFDEPKRISPVESGSGFEQIEKTCKTCGAVRITIIGGPYPRSWRLKDESVQRPFEPFCKVIGVVA